MNDIDDLLARLGMRIWNSDVDEALGFEAADTIRTLRADNEYLSEMNADLDRGNSGALAEVDSLRDALAGRDATIAAAYAVLWKHGLPGGSRAAITEARRILAASPTDALAADRARACREALSAAADYLDRFERLGMKPGGQLSDEERVEINGHVLRRMWKNAYPEQVTEPIREWLRVFDPKPEGNDHD